MSSSVRAATALLPSRRPIASDVDMVGEWIRMAQEVGSHLHFPVGIIRRGSDTPEWRVYSHAERDGLGGIMHALQDTGYRVCRFPQFRDPVPPSPLAIRLAVLRSLVTSQRLRTPPWQRFRAARGKQHSGHAWFVFTRDQTEALRAACRARGVTVSTLLFWCANRTIPTPLLRTPTDPRAWVMTVNMRGPLQLPSEFGNLSSSMDVQIPDGTSIEGLHRLIQDEARRNSHWVRVYWTWGFKTPARLRAFHKRFPRFAVRFRIGAFSNAGEFPRDYVEPTARSGDVSDIEAMILGGVTGMIHPVACVPLSWNGRLALSLCLASQLVDDLEVTKDYLAHWIEDVLRELALPGGADVRAGVRGASWDEICRGSVGTY